jgi:hypothetical protein
MSKDNARNNYSSTNYAKILINFLMKRKKKGKKITSVYKKMGLKV